MGTVCDALLPEHVLRIGEVCYGADPADDRQQAWEYAQDEMGTFYPTGSCDGGTMIVRINAFGRPDAICADSGTVSAQEWAVWGSGGVQPCIDARDIRSAEGICPEPNMDTLTLTEVPAAPVGPMLPITGVDTAPLVVMAVGMILAGSVARLGAWFVRH